MAEISQNVNIEMLEKLPDGTYKKKHPETKASMVIAEDGSNLESHLAEKASQNKLGHVKVDEKTIFINEDGEISVSNPYPHDLSGSPGSKFLIAGDMNAGFFGVVPASELFTGAEISSECGITQGTLQFSDVGWLKFAIDGEIIFKSQKTYRHSISYDHINSKGCVHGETQVSKNGINYKATLMKGALTDPSADVGGDRGAKGSEWNRLMLPIHIEAKDKSWVYPAYVESDVPYWGIDFTDADLQTHYNHGDGVYQWCQEVLGTNTAGRVLRGSLGVSNSNYYASSNTQSNCGWSPVLRVVK